MIHLQRERGLALLELRHEKDQNPFTIGMTRELARLCDEVEADEDVAGVLIWGGAGRSFSVGGDFADVQRHIRTQEDGLEYLGDIVRSYQAVLRVSKPVVTAVDHYAIGQGLQVALLGDWRIGSERSSYSMPELANGMPCPLGSALLEAMLGRAAMLRLVVGCDALDAERAREQLLINEVCSPAALKSAGLERLALLCGYPELPYRLTKRIHNARLIESLEAVRDAAAEAHVASYFAGSADRRFAEILGKTT